MIAGITSAHRPSRMATPISFTDARGVVCTSCPRATHHQAAVRPTAIIRPGTMAARNSLVIDRPAVTPNRMRFGDGGTIGPMMLPEAIRPTDFLGS